MPLTPTHQAIVDKMGGYFPVFRDYAKRQGYTSACAQDVVALHEVLHVLSAQVNGFIYDEEMFPNRYHPVMDKLSFSNIAMHAKLLKHPLMHHSIMHQYIAPNPGGTLNMILDEVVVYHQTLPYLKGDAHYQRYAHFLVGQQMAFALGFAILSQEDQALILEEYAGLFARIE
jgi:hypothetical protein